MHIFEDKNPQSFWSPDGALDSWSQEGSLYSNDSTLLHQQFSSLELLEQVLYYY